MRPRSALDGGPQEHLCFDRHTAVLVDSETTPISPLPISPSIPNPHTCHAAGLRGSELVPFNGIGPCCRQVCCLRHTLFTQLGELRKGERLAAQKFRFLCRQRSQWLETFGIGAWFGRKSEFIRRLGSHDIQVSIISYTKGKKPRNHFESMLPPARFELRGLEERSPSDRSFSAEMLRALICTRIPVPHARTWQLSKCNQISRAWAGSEVTHI